MLVFSQPLSRPDEFDPSSKSVYGLLQGGSHQREEPHMMMTKQCVIHTRKEEEALIKERNLMDKERNQEEALHKERDLTRHISRALVGRTSIVIRIPKWTR